MHDGAHGFSPLIGRYCGPNFPDTIDSKGRFLWLIFHSDENIEDKGFKAVYDLVPRPTSGMHAICDMLVETGRACWAYDPSRRRCCCSEKKCKRTFLIQCRCWVYTRLSTRGECLVYISRNGKSGEKILFFQRSVSLQYLRFTLHLKGPAVSTETQSWFSQWKIEGGILALTISFFFSLIITFFTVFVHLFRYRHSGVYDDEPCNETFNLYHGLINTTANIKPDRKEFLMKNKLPLDCMWVIHVEEGWKVSQHDSCIHSLALNIYSSILQIQINFVGPFKLDKPNDCDSNFVDIFGEKTEIAYRWVAMCAIFVYISNYRRFNSPSTVWSIMRKGKHGKLLKATENLL